MEFNLADILIFVVIAASGVMALFRGFVREMLALITWILALWAGFAWNRHVADFLARWLESPGARWAVAFLLLFTGVLALSAMLNWLMSTLIRKSGLSGTDRAIGLCFGVLRGFLVVAVIAGLARVTPLTEERLWRDSVLLPYVLSASDRLVAQLPRQWRPEAVVPAWGGDKPSRQSGPTRSE
jgi:membrane protein required for colicin V production